MAQVTKGGALGVEAQARAALLLGRDPEVGPVRLIHRGGTNREWSQ